MANVLTIAERELRGYFAPPFVWILAALLAACAGIVLILQDIDSIRSGSIPPALIFAPVAASALTMRALAQEYKLGTIELLLTAPSRAWEIVLGKFLAAWATLSVLLLPVLWLGLQVMRYHDPEIAVTVSAFLMVLFLGAAFVGMGVLASSVASNPLAAFALSMMLCGLWFAAVRSDALGELSDAGDFSRGGTELYVSLFMVGVTALSLVLTVYVVSRRRD